MGTGSEGKLISIGQKEFRRGKAFREWFITNPGYLGKI